MSAASPRTSGSEPAARGHHRHAGPHGLQRREAEPLVERRVGEHGGLGQKGCQGGLLDPPRPHDPAAGGRRGDGDSEPVFVPARRPRQHEGDVAVAERHLAECPHQPRQVLARFGRPDGQAVAAGPRRQQPGPKAGTFGLGDGRQLGDAGAHHAHPGGIGPERLDHLAPDEGRIGMDPGAPAEGAADQPRVGQGRLVAELWVVEGREVVDRDDRHGSDAPAARRSSSRARRRMRR